MRLFIAINFDDEVKRKLVEMQNRLRKCALRGNFTSYNNLHLTLVFLGEVSDNLELLHKAMNNVTVSPFSITISGDGRFKRDRGDIWWAGVEENGSLNLLQSQLSKALLDTGFPVEERKYTPHLTLAREVQAKDGGRHSVVGSGVAIDVLMYQKSALCTPPGLTRFDIY